MKATHYILPISVLAFALSACNDEIEPSSPEARPGMEVSFNGSLSETDPQGRTVYGSESNNKFPIYWENGDLVHIVSPQCLTGRNSAEYKVAVDVTTQNYASTLTKTGEVGIQWGENTEADFYSVYPGTNNMTISADKTVSAKFEIESTQIAGIANGTEPNEKGVYELKSDMSNAIMYAQSKGTAGDPVYLQYHPYATVIEFTLNGPNEAQSSNATIQSITLNADSNIAGTFDLVFDVNKDTPSVENVTNASKSITLSPLQFASGTTEGGSYITLTRGQSLKVKMFLMPTELTMSDKWTFTVTTLNGNYVKTLDVTNGALAPGKVHKVVLPALNKQGEWKYDTSNWITSLPEYKTIYLSELSLPGSWQSWTKKQEYQYYNDQNKENENVNSIINHQWSKGIRAFHVESRVQTEAEVFNYDGVPSDVAISGTGSNSGLFPQEGSSYYYSGKSISEVIKAVAEKVKGTEEFATLTITYADGGTGGHRPEDYEYYLKGVSKIVNGLITSGVVDNIYQEAITPQTTIQDVLNQLVIIMTVDHRFVGKSDSYGNDMPLMLAYADYVYGGNVAYASNDKFSQLHHKDWDDSYKTADDATWNVADLDVNSMWLNYSYANRTYNVADATEFSKNNLPTYAGRQKALSTMISNSDKVYVASTHNVWLLFGAGGTAAANTTDDSTKPKDFAASMNGWVKDQIETKITNNKPSPLGMVYCNFICDKDNQYKGADVIKAIIEMNNKFYLKHAPKTSTGGDDDDTAPKAENNATVVAGGATY